MRRAIPLGGNIQTWVKTLPQIVVGHHGEHILHCVRVVRPALPLVFQPRGDRKESLPLRHEARAWRHRFQHAPGAAAARPSKPTKGSIHVAPRRHHPALGRYHIRS